MINAPENVRITATDIINIGKKFVISTPDLTRAFQYYLDNNFVTIKTKNGKKIVQINNKDTK